MGSFQTRVTQPPLDHVPVLPKKKRGVVSRLFSLSTEGGGFSWSQLIGVDKLTSPVTRRELSSTGARSRVTIPGVNDGPETP